MSNGDTHEMAIPRYTIAMEQLEDGFQEPQLITADYGEAVMYKDHIERIAQLTQERDAQRECATLRGNSIQRDAEKIAALEHRNEALESVLRAAEGFLECCDWNDANSERDATNIMYRISEALTAQKEQADAGK